MSGISVAAVTNQGAPWVGVTVDGLASGSASVISIDRSWDGGVTWLGVRGAQRIQVVGGTFVRDHACPLNVSTTYRLTVHSGATTPATLTAAVTVTSPWAWLSDPLDARSGVPVALESTEGALSMWATSLAASRRSQPVDLATPEGASMPVASIGARGTPRGVPIELYAVPAAQGELISAIRRLFKQAGQLVVRGLPAALDLDPVAHVIAPDVDDVPVIDGVLGEITRWSTEITQVRPTSLRLAVPYWTYAQVAALWAGQTYAQALAARPGETYLDWLRSPEVP